MLKYLSFITLIMVVFIITTIAAVTPLVDSNMSLEEALKDSKAPKNILDSQCIVSVKYISFDGKLHQGQLIVNIAVKADIEEIFKIILKAKFPISKVIPIVKYDWLDEVSMDDDNTSAFNFRFVANTTRLSNHARGKAIDINPYENPAVYSDGKISPNGAKYNVSKPGTIKANSFIVKEFLKRGWRWGGNFTSLKDYQHFDKE
ncbi:MAG: putative cytosolic protein [Ignavibacteria bacterium]|nr:putative cytosolic protein [Ignavibacteria bacterium]